MGMERLADMGRASSKARGAHGNNDGSNMRKAITNGSNSEAYEGNSKLVVKFDNI